MPHSPKTAWWRDPRVITVAGGSIGLAVGLVVWQIVSAAEPVLFASPAASFTAVADLARTGELGAAALDSGRTFAVGLLIALLIGIPFGLILSRARIVRRGLLWLVFALQAVPLVALAPMVSATIGYGFSAKVLLVFLAAFFPVVLNTMEGGRNAPALLLDVAKVTRSSEVRIWRDILVPFTLPYIMTGVRQAIATAMIGTLVAEFFLNVSGIGAILLAASARFDIATVLGVTVTLAVAAVALISIGRGLERLASPWQR